jgi:tetratricopeptide (TPR) repeat protein
MDLNNQVIKLCIEGTQLEFRGERDGARELYQKAWNSAFDDFEACIAAHYLGHLEDDPERKLQWDEVALEKADSCNNEEVKEFYPSLYLNLGRSHELLGNQEEAQKFYDLAADLGLVHHPKDT